MAISRRNFLRRGSVFGVAAIIPGMLNVVAFGQEKGNAAALGSGIDNPLPKEVFEDSLYKLSKDRFEANVTTTFDLRLSKTESVALYLLKVTDLRPERVRRSLGADKDSTVKECFSLLFKGPPHTRLAQGTYTIRHEKLGKFRLFLVPADDENTYGLGYVAIINRFMP